MYRSLNPVAAGISGRQSEQIEIALTFGFGGLNVDVEELSRRVNPDSLAATRQMFDSAQIKVGGFKLPIGCRAEAAQYETQKAGLTKLLEIAAAIGASHASAAVFPDSHLPYHDDFELHRARIAEMGELLAAQGIRLGLRLLAAPAHRSGTENPFVHEAETIITLLDAVGHDNVGLILDTWNWVVGGGTIDQVAAMRPERIVAVTLADMPADVDLKLASESQRTVPAETVGAIDTPGFLRALKKIGYAGPVTIVPDSENITSETRDAPAIAIKNAFDHLWEAAELSEAPV